MAQSSGGPSLWDQIELVAREHPAKCAIQVLDNDLHVAECVTYESLRRMVLEAADGLREAKLQSALFLLFQQEPIEFIVSFLAVNATGGTVAPLNPRFALRRSETLAGFVTDAEPAALLVDCAAIERARVANGAVGLPVLSVTDLRRPRSGPPRVSRDDNQPRVEAVIQYTSGSTSAPKGVRVSNANLLANAWTLSTTFQRNLDDVIVSWLPFFHDMGLMTGVVWPLTNGASTVLLRPSTFSARPMSWLQAISRFKGTVSSAPNFAYQMCLGQSIDGLDLDLSSWGVAICGAEPVQSKTMQQFAVEFSRAGFDPASLIPSYGLAEATLFVSGGPRQDGAKLTGFDRDTMTQGLAHKPNAAGPRVTLVSCGSPAVGFDVRIADPLNQREKVSGAVGEIWVRGPSVSLGYLNREVHPDFCATLAVETVDGTSSLEGFLRTGDLGFFFEGDLYVAGRLKDVIIVRGVKYWPHDLELTSSKSHPLTQGGRCVALAESFDGSEGVTIIQEIGRCTPDEANNVIGAIRRRIGADHGVAPSRIALTYLRRLPLTTSGKVRRQPTRQALLEGSLHILADWVASGNESAANKPGDRAASQGVGTVTGPDFVAANP